LKERDCRGRFWMGIVAGARRNGSGAVFKFVWSGR
jgi:hypothetical protein